MEQSDNIETSEAVADIFAALSAFQAEVVGTVKNARGHHGAYSDLTDMWAAIREPLTKHGLALLQFPCGGDDKTVRVCTMLTHKSGQWIKAPANMPIPKGGNLAQQTGSAISYIKRYAGKGALGLPDVDTDAAAVAPPPAQGKAPQKAGPDPRLAEALANLEKVNTPEEMGVWDSMHRDLPEDVKAQLRKPRGEIIAGFKGAA